VWWDSSPLTALACRRTPRLSGSGATCSLTGAPSATAPERQAGGPRGRADRAESTSRRAYRASNSVVSEFQLGRIIAGTEKVLRSDAVTIPRPPRPPTLRSGRCADCLRRGTGRAPQAESNVYSLSGARQPADPPTPSLRPSIRARSGPLGIRQEKRQQELQKRDLKLAERRWSAAAVQTLVLYQCANEEQR